ncbi:MAG: YdcF family protein [Cyanobacteriota bacterium]
MFELRSCFRPIPYSVFRLPVFTDWSEMGWRKQLLLVVFISLVIFGIRWILQNKKARRWLRSRKVIISLLCITASIPLIFIVAAKGLVAFLPTDTGETAQVIVVLGRGPKLGKERITAAAELWQTKRAPMIFVSGFIDAYELIPQIKAKGIPNPAVDGENCSRTTWENALFSAAILHPQQIRKILLVTDGPHMWRSLLLFRANGFTVIPHPTPLPPSFGFKSTAFLTIREYLGLVGYSLQGLFHPDRSPQVDSPVLKNLLQAAKQYGQQQRIESQGVSQE